jgi:hypothetical protein
MAVMKLKTETGEVMIDLEKLGFPASVIPPPEQVAAKLADLLTDRDNWRDRAEDAQKREKASKERDEKLADLECDLFLQDAANNFKIEKAIVPYLKKMWKSDPATVREMVDAAREKSYLKTEQGLSGSDAGPTDPIAKVMAKSAELIANNKNMTVGEAQLQVLKDDPKLSAEYRLAMLAGPSKGGDR